MEKQTVWSFLDVCYGTFQSPEILVIGCVLDIGIYLGLPEIIIFYSVQVPGHFLQFLY